MKKLLATILSMVLILSAVPALAVNAESGDTDKLDTLAELVAAIDAAEASEDKVVTLEGNIDMTGATYPIATLTNGVVINGNGYALTNLTMIVDNSEATAETAKDLSIFALAENASVIIRNLTIGSEENKVVFENTPSESPYLDDGTGENYAVLVAEVFKGMSLSVDNVDIYATMTTKVNGGSVVGGFAAVVEGSATFFGCSMNGSIISEATTSVYGRAGGFVGAATGFSSLTFNNCVNNADVKGEVNSGGFIAFTRSHGVTVNNCTNNGKIGHIGQVPTVGGFIGKISINETASGSHFDGEAPATEIKYTIANCVNNGAITSTQSKAYTGGLIGWATGSSAAGGAMSLLNCINNGAISTKANSTTTTQRGTGGIVGQIKTYWNTTIDSCLNFGDVSCAASNYDFVGGIVGVHITTSNNYTDTITNCYNEGTVTSKTSSTKQWPCAAGIVGFYPTATAGALNITKCYTANTINATCPSYIIVTQKASATKATVSDCGSYGTLASLDGNGVTGTNFTEYADLSVFAEALNSSCKAGRFVAVEDEYIEDHYVSLDFIPAPVAVGAQISNVKTVGGKKVVDVRFLAVLKDAELENYSKVGFKIDAVNTDGAKATISRSGEFVYTSILATTDEGARRYTNTDLNGEYIIAITVENVPADAADTVELTATAFVSGDVSGVSTDIFSANTTAIKLVAGKYSAS